MQESEDNDHGQRHAEQPQDDWHGFLLRLFRAGMNLRALSGFPLSGITTLRAVAKGQRYPPVMAGEGPPSTSVLIRARTDVDADLHRHDGVNGSPRHQAIRCLASGPLRRPQFAQPLRFGRIEAILHVAHHLELDHDRAGPMWQQRNAVGPAT